MPENGKNKTGKTITKTKSKEAVSPLFLKVPKDN
jgi:hypothetical protein